MRCRVYCQPELCSLLKAAIFVDYSAVIRSWEVQFDGGAATIVGDYSGKPSGLKGKTVNHAQSESVVIVGLAGKKWLKRSQSGFLVHTGAVIGDGEHHVVTCAQIRGQQFRGIVYADIVGLQHQSASAGHGIAGIGTDIENGLFKLFNVQTHWPQSVVQDVVNTDLLSHRTLYAGQQVCQCLAILAFTGASAC